MITFLSHLIVEADKARVLGQVIAAEEYYEQAIDAAKANASLEEEALAYELAAKYYLERGRPRFAQNYMKESYYAYRRLDATAKVKELETKYPRLLFELSSANSNTSTCFTSPKMSSISSEGALESLEAVIRANIAISSEIELERLLRVLIKILIENADAQTGYLILPSPTNLENGEEWKIAASGIIDTEASDNTLGKPVFKIGVQSLPIDDHLPTSIINYVIHTLENVVVDDASCEGKFIHDPYIQQHQTKSILCAPLLNQDKLIGIVYLENNLTNGVFTKTQLNTLQLLFTQAAISIHNAKIFSQLRENEKQLSVREKRVNQILNVMPIAVTAHDTTGRYIYSNLKAQQLVGIKAPLEIKTEQLSEVFQVYQAGTDQLYPINKLPVVRTFAGESVKINDMELRQGDKTIPLEVLTVPIFDETGAIIYAIAAFIDITERKQAQKLLADYNQTLETQIAERTEKLQQQNEILQALFDHIPVMLKLRDQTDQTLVINREYERVLGWTLDDLRDIDWLAKCYPDTEQRQQIREHIEAATGKWQDFRTRCRDGRYVDTTWANIRLSTGQIIGIGQDISDRKQLEKALQASQAKLNDILNSAGASIASFRVYPDRSWDREYHSLGCENIFGYTPQELTPELWLSRVPSEDLTVISEQAFAAIAQEQPTTLEYRFYHKNSSLRWIADTLTSRWDQAGGCWIVTMVGVDITARKQAEMALQESEQFLRSIYEGTAAAIFIVDVLEDGRFRYVDINPAHEWMSGLFSSEMAGKTPEQIFPPEDAQVINARFVACTTIGQRITYEERLEIRGKETWWINVLTPIYTEDGQIYRLIGSCFNITRRKKLEHSLRSQADQEHLLGTITQHIRQSLDLDQILATTVVEVQRTLQADRALIFRLNQDGSGQVIKEAVVPEYPMTSQMRWTDECFPNDCYEYYRQGNARILPDVAKDEWADCLVEFMQQIGVKSKVVAPIVQTLEDSSTRVWGLLIVHACSNYRHWRASEAEFLQQISNQLAIALHQANLYNHLQTELAEHKQTEAALRQNQAHLAMAQKVSQIGSWEFDVNSQNISCSQTTFHQWGIEPVKGEPSFSELLERVHPDDREVLQQKVEQAITKKISYVFDLRIMRPDGSIRYLDSRAEPVLNAQGQVIQLIGTSLDITERKQAEEYLRESEERFRKAFDAAPIGVALVSPQGQFLMVNHSLCEIVGYTEAEMLNLTMMEITHRDDLEADLELMQKLLANEIRVYQVEKRYLHNRGNTIHILLNVSLVRDQHREPLYFIAQIQDISDRYEVDRIKNEFISIVSHELRTPLTAIRGAVGILETGVFDHEPEQAREMLQIAFNNSDRLVRLVNDILDLERLESGKIQLVTETCETANLVKQAIETVQAMANEAGVKIFVMVPNMQISAAADSIIQTLINLLSNAIKFSPAGGTVWLSAELVRDRKSVV